MYSEQLHKKVETYPGGNLNGAGVLDGGTPMAHADLRISLYVACL